jgi:hypothetical protein
MTSSRRGVAGDVTLLPRSRLATKMVVDRVERLYPTGITSHCRESGLALNLKGEKNSLGKD